MKQTIQQIVERAWGKLSVVWKRAVVAIVATIVIIIIVSIGYNIGGAHVNDLENELTNTQNELLASERANELLQVKNDESNLLIESCEEQIAEQQIELESSKNELEQVKQENELLRQTPVSQPSSVSDAETGLSAEGGGEAQYNTSDGVMVWIASSGNGTKYHSGSSCSNMENPNQVSKSDAIAWGYEACKKCW